MEYVKEGEAVSRDLSPSHISGPGRPVLPRTLHVVARALHARCTPPFLPASTPEPSNLFQYDGRKLRQHRLPADLQADGRNRPEGKPARGTGASRARA